MKMTRIVFAFLATQLFTPYVSADSATNEVKAVFESYVLLERKFDPAVADLYSDEAILRHTRRLTNGTTRLITSPATKFKQLMRDTMPVAKQQQDFTKYSDVIYKKEGANVRVTCIRHSELKRYSSPFSLVLAKRGDKWLIVEEISESRQ